MEIIEDGFLLYSAGIATVPPVGHLHFSNPPGDVHLKYGYIAGDDYFVVKVASGFYNNPTLGISSSNGVMLIFSQKTGAPLAILMDEGYLTDIRTALAGAVVAKYLAPSFVNHIGIVGTGIQARLQPEFIKTITQCRSLFVWGRHPENVKRYAADMVVNGFDVCIAHDLNTLTRNCNLIVTTTASKEPILFGKDIFPGTHLTAVGADAKGKQELDESVFTKADTIVADSISQCSDDGDLSYALKKGTPLTNKIIELGKVINNKSRARKNDTEITIADLTGVAVQDLQIAKFVYERLKVYL